MQSQILVVGSINMDLAVRCPRIPVPGETILGTGLVESPGGKGANQAVAVGRLGGQVSMIGCLGTDTYRQLLRRSLREAGVAVDHVGEHGDRSGIALIEVSDQGENSIVVVPGANALLTPEAVRRAFDAEPRARIVLLQLEIPLDTVRAAARLARARGMQVLLDPAPARPLPDDLLADVDILLPNQGEAGMLAGMPVVERAEAEAAARRLLDRGPRIVALKLGANGVLIIEAASTRHIPGLRVATVDTTAAGDCLAGALAVALVEGQDLVTAMTFANAAAAISTTRLGAQDSMPTRAAVASLIAG